MDRQSDIVFLTETWLHSDNNSISAEAKTFGYKFLHNRRKDREKEGGDGVGFLVKSSLSAKQLAVKHYKSFEHTIRKLHFLTTKLGSLYRFIDYSMLMDLPSLKILQTF